MNEFKIAGKQGSIQIELSEVYAFPNETSYLGGYDVKGKINIKSGNYYVKDAVIWSSSGQIYQFFIQLQKCYKDLKGSATFSESKNNLKIDLNFNRFGQINIQGYF